MATHMFHVSVTHTVPSFVPLRQLSVTLIVVMLIRLILLSYENEDSCSRVHCTVPA